MHATILDTMKADFLEKYKISIYLIAIINRNRSIFEGGWTDKFGNIQEGINSLQKLNQIDEVRIMTRFVETV